MMVAACSPISITPPKATVPGGNDSHTHYSYYTSGPWTDRVQPDVARKRQQ